MATKTKKPAPKSTGLTDAQILATLKTNHPQWAQFVIQNPELKATVIKWAKIPGGPSQEQIDAAIFPTKLVQEYNANQQSLSKIQALSPGEFKYQSATAQKEVNDYINASGLTVDPATKIAIFNQHFYQGMPLTDSRITKQLGSKFDATKTQTGLASQTTGSLQGLSNSYMIPMTPETLSIWGKKISAGQATLNDFEDTLKTQASGLYPFMKGTINAMTPASYFDPLKSMIQKNLEINPSKIDFNDPSGKWMNLATTRDPKTGENIARTLSDSIKEMRTNPIYGYDYTQGAKDSAFDLGSQIRSMMGFGA